MQGESEAIALINSPDRLGERGQPLAVAARQVPHPGTGEGPVPEHVHGEREGPQVLRDEPPEGARHVWGMVGWMLRQNECGEGFWLIASSVLPAGAKIETKVRFWLLTFPQVIEYIRL